MSYTDPSRPGGVRSTDPLAQQHPTDPLAPQRATDPLIQQRSAPQISGSTWLIGGLVALALIVGGMFMFGDNRDTTASIGNSGTTSSAPASPPASPTPPATPAR